MAHDSWLAKSKQFRAAHDGAPLVLPNAWDAGSAAVIAGAGAAAIATSSAGVSWSLGYRDGERVSRETMGDVVRRIVRVVDLPVSVDAEAGYGPGPDDVAATVTAMLDAGAVGLNLEDSRETGGPLFSVDEQCARIEAARNAASAAGFGEFFVNARTDVYLLGIGEPDGRLDEVISRGRAWAEAGADGFFVPWLLELDVLSDLVAAISLPVNVSALPGGPSVSEFAGTGVQRISLGSGTAQTAMAAAKRVAQDALSQGTFDMIGDALDFEEINGFIPDL